MRKNKLQLIGKIFACIIFISFTPKAHSLSNCDSILRDLKSETFVAKGLYDKAIEFEKKLWFEGSLQLLSDAAFSVSSAQAFYLESQSLNRKCPRRSNQEWNSALNQLRELTQKVPCRIRINEANVIYSNYLATQNEALLKMYVERIQGAILSLHCTLIAN